MLVPTTSPQPKTITPNPHSPNPSAHAAPRPSHTQEWEVGKVRSGCFPTSHSQRAHPFAPHHSNPSTTIVVAGDQPPTLPQFAGPGHVSYLHVGPDRPIVPLRSLPSDPPSRLSPTTRIRPITPSRTAFSTVLQLRRQPPPFFFHRHLTALKV